MIQLLRSDEVARFTEISDPAICIYIWAGIPMTYLDCLVLARCVEWR